MDSVSSLFRSPLNRTTLQLALPTCLLFSTLEPVLAALYFLSLSILPCLTIFFLATYGFLSFL